MSLRFVSLAIVVAAFIVGPAEIMAQAPKASFHEKPFAIIVNRITQTDAAEYIRSLSEKLQIGEDWTASFNQYQKQQYQGDVERPLTGNLFFLQKAIMPSVAALEFQEVLNEAAYEKLIRNNSKQWGESATLTGKDGKYKVSRSSTHRVEISSEELAPEPRTEPGTEPEEAPKHSISINLGTNQPVISYQSLEDSEIYEEDGKTYRDTESSWHQYYRYHGSLMYTSTNEAVWEMALPTIGGVLKDASRKVDMAAEVYLERIPNGLKSLGWSMLYGGVSTEMQQRDGESDVDYNFRSAGGRLGLAVAKAGMFDSDHVSAAVEYATAQNPLRAHFSIDARKSSDLSKRLADLSSGESRFAPLVNDDAAFTLHLAARLPEESIEVFKSGGEFLKDQLMQRAGTDVDLVLSGAEIAETLGQIADQNNLELFAKIGWSETSGGVIYGGMRVGDNPELLQSVLTLVTPESTPTDIVDRFDLTKKDGMDVIEFLIPAEGQKDDSPVRLSHLYITHAHSCLWIAIGGEQCHDILKQSIQRCESSGLRTNARVFTAALDLEKWLSYPDDDSTGLTTLPQFADAMMVNQMESEIGTQISDDRLMQKVLALGGRQNIQIHLESSSAGLKLSTEVGKAFGNYIVARYLQAMDVAMENFEPPEPDIDRP